MGGKLAGAARRRRPAVARRDTSSRTHGSSARPRRRSPATGRWTRMRPAHLDDVDLGIVRAACGVAETGSVLRESQLRVEALGFLAQHLLVLLDPRQIVPSVHDVYTDEVHERALRGPDDRAFGHRRHRGRADPRCAGGKNPHRRRDSPPLTVGGRPRAAGGSARVPGGRRMMRTRSRR